LRECPGDALRSDYPEFQPHAGVDAAGLGFSASWFLSTRWMLNADAAVERLSSSARNSPLTAQRTQHVVTTSVVYRW